MALEKYSAKASAKQNKAYNMFEKSESPKVKKAELKKPETKSDKAKELKAGMQMMKGKPAGKPAIKKKK